MSAILHSTTPNEIVPVSHVDDSSREPMRYYRFKPWNMGRVIIWSVFASCWWALRTCLPARWR